MIGALIYFLIAVIVGIVSYCTDNFDYSRQKNPQASKVLCAIMLGCGWIGMFIVLLCAAISQVVGKIFRER